MKVTIRKAKHDYPGSTFRLVILELGNGREHNCFGIRKEIDKQGATYWEHDSKGLWWFTQAEVKAHALREIELSLAHNPKLFG